MNPPSRHAVGALIALAITGASASTATATDSTVPASDDVATPSPAAADTGEATHNYLSRSGEDCSPTIVLVGRLPGPIGKALVSSCQAGSGARAQDNEPPTVHARPHGGIGLNTENHASRFLRRMVYVDSATQFPVDPIGGPHKREIDLLMVLMERPDEWGGMDTRSSPANQ